MRGHESLFYTEEESPEKVYKRPSSKHTIITYKSTKVKRFLEASGGGGWRGKLQRNNV